MRCLLTGFDAFGETDVNPSQSAVERVADTLRLDADGADVPVTKLILTTCCGEAWSAVEAHAKAMDAKEPFFVLLSGFAGGRDRICLERFALNVRQYRIADNRGHQWRDEFIDKGAPDALRTTLPLDDLANALGANSLACDVSNYAGSFVCNETYYLTMQKWQADKRCMGVLFMHFPSPANYATVVKTPEFFGENAELDVIAEYAKALTETIKFVALRASVNV